MFLFDNSPGGGRFPSKGGPSRCVMCQGTYDMPRASCRAEVHPGNAAAEPWVPTHRTQALPSVAELAADMGATEAELLEYAAEFVRAPAPEPWPCRECGKVPDLHDVDERPWYGCGGMGSHSVVVTDLYDTVPGAGASWNKRFGQEPVYPYCKTCGVCITAEGCKCSNPHGLAPCACGEIPRPVAYRYDGGHGYLYWGVMCKCGRCFGGWDHFSNIVMRWNEGLRDEEHEGVAAGRSHRYDLPTDLVLGCAELPEEYRVAERDPNIHKGTWLCLGCETELPSELWTCSC